MQNALTLCIMHCIIMNNNTYCIVERSDNLKSLPKKARLEAGFSLESAAKELNISAGYLSQIENGQRQVSSKRATQIAKLYKKNKDDIFLPSRYAVREVDEITSKEAIV